MNKNISTWLGDVTLLPVRPSLSGDITTEVVIIGAGLAGTLSSYLLSKAGKRVAVLEKKDISHSITAYTTAWLNCVIDTDLSDLMEMYTPAGAKKIWTSGMEAIDLIEKIAKEENIDCDFSHVSHYRYTTSDKEMENLKEEHSSAKQLGFETFLHDKRKLPWANSGSLELKNQAKFHPIKFLVGLRAAAEKYGAVFYDNTEVQKLEGGEVVVALTKSGTVKADYSITATYQPFNKPPELFAHKGMYVSYVLEANIPKNTIPEGLYEDEKNPYHYFRIDNSGKSDRMVLGGEDHRKEIPIPKDKNFRALKSYLAKLLPDTKYEIVREWSGSILETIDGLPYIGKYSKKYDNRLIATGFSGNGMTYSAVASQILRDIILKKQNPYIDLYSASRKAKLYNLMKKGRDFSSEFFGGFVKNIFK